MKTIEEHNEHCKKIADELFEVWDNTTYKCPHCGGYIIDDREFDKEGLVTNVDDDHDESGAMRCQNCDDWVQFDDWTSDDYAEQMTVGQYLFDDCFDVEVTRKGIDPRGEVSGVKVCIGFGGPNVYVDTNDCKVKLYWWGDYGEWPIENDVAVAIDDYAQELSECY